MKTVSVHIVTYNSAEHIYDCLQAVMAQSYPIEQIIVVDNASKDGTLAKLAEWSDKCVIVPNAVNNGFAGGHNQAIRLSKADYCLILNPDVVLDPEYVQGLVDAFHANSLIGSATGRLLFKANHDVIDSTGLVINKARRAFDRGANESSEAYQQAGEVFGVSGAAAMYARSMIDDISVNGEFFDEDFFAYKEDVDVAWRARIMGWKAWYEPTAIAYHERGWKEGGRKNKPLFVRRLSYINRYKMLLKNDRWRNAVKHFIPIIFYELASFVYALVREPKLLGAWASFFRKLPELREKRKLVQSKRKVTDSELYKWFS